MQQNRLSIRQYDIIVKDCRASTRLIRFDTSARRLFVPSEISQKIRWWRAESDNFVIQLVERQ